MKAFKVEAQCRDVSSQRDVLSRNYIQSRHVGTVGFIYLHTNRYEPSYHDDRLQLVISREREFRRYTHGTVD